MQEQLMETDEAMVDPVKHTVELPGFGKMSGSVGSRKPQYSLPIVENEAYLLNRTSQENSFTRTASEDCNPLRIEESDMQAFPQ